MEFYKKHVAGAEINETTNVAIIFYSSHALHGAPISLNIFLNAILNRTITVNNKPLNIIDEQHFQKSETRNILIWLFMLPLCKFHYCYAAILLARALKNDSVVSPNHCCRFLYHNVRRLPSVVSIVSFSFSNCSRQNILSILIRNSILFYAVMLSF